MKGYEHEIKGTVIVNASDPDVESDLRYMVVKIVDDEPWFITSTNVLERAEIFRAASNKHVPTFIIDKGERL